MLSIILPSIRPHNLEKLYNSIRCRDFELVIVSPYDLPENLKQHKNIKYVRDWGSPARAQQIGAVVSEGDIITWMADDAVYIRELDSLVDDLRTKHEKTVFCYKYSEGGSLIYHDECYKLKNVYPDYKRIPYVKDNWWIFNVSFMHRSFFDELGGWDCEYEATSPAHTDLALRAQVDGAEAFMFNMSILECTHMMTTTGDHAPIHYAHTQHDEELYCTKNQNPTVRIALDNWKRAPKVWARRFK